MLMGTTSYLTPHGILQYWQSRWGNLDNDLQREFLSRPEVGELAAVPEGITRHVIRAERMLAPATERALVLVEAQARGSRVRSRRRGRRRRGRDWERDVEAQRTTSKTHSKKSKKLKRSRISFAKSGNPLDKAKKRSTLRSRDGRFPEAPVDTEHHRKIGPTQNAEDSF